MNKSASDPMQSPFPHDPKTTLLLSLLLGGGVYAGARGIKNVSNYFSPPEKDTSQLTIDIPQSRMHKTGNHALGPYELPQQILALLGGGAAGFLGASGLYKAIQNKMIDSDEKKTQKAYMNQLQSIHNKMGEAKTPLVDTFCAGLLAKLASDMPMGPGLWEASAHQLSNLGDQAKDFGGQVKNLGMGALEGLYNKGKEKLHGVQEAAIDNPVTGIGASALLLSALLSGGATYGIGRSIDKHKKEKEQLQTYPSSVNLNIV